MSAGKTGIETIRDELLPQVESLCGLVDGDRDGAQFAFFDRIRQGIAAAREPDDLAGPFMELSTSAFLGFAFSPSVQVQLDRVLALAQEISFTLSASADDLH